jgi:hypothetical protein
LHFLSLWSLSLCFCLRKCFPVTQSVSHCFHSPLERMSKHSWARQQQSQHPSYQGYKLTTQHQQTHVESEGDAEVSNCCTNREDTNWPATPWCRARFVLTSALLAPRVSGL